MPHWDTHETNETGADANLRFDRVEFEALSASSVVVSLEEEEEYCVIPMQGRLGKKVWRRRAPRHDIAWSKKGRKGSEARAERRVAPSRKLKHRGLDYDILYE